MLQEQELGALDYVARLAVVKAAGLDILLDLRDIGFGEALQRGEALKSAGVILLTRSSVHWAARRTENSSS